MVGVLTLELAILEARSLKDKRRVVHGLKQKIRNRFNVSVAETGYHDMHKRCRLDVAMVSNESRPLHSQLDKIVDAVRGTPGVSLINYERELF